MKILLIEDNVDEAQRCQDYFVSCNDVELIGVTGSASEGLTLAAKHYPDAIILDIELDEGDGLHFLLQLKKLNLPVKPYVLVTTWTSEHRTIQAMKNNGAGFVQSKFRPAYKEHGPEIVLGILRDMEPYFSCGADGVPVTQHYFSPMTLELLKREKISEALGRIKINRGNITQAYLVEAIYLGSEMLAGGEFAIDMENVIYPKMEEKFGVKRSAMEKSMRTRIEYVWRHVPQEILAHEYTQYVDADKSKPILTDFVGYYADKFK